MPFRLWPAQITTLDAIWTHQLTQILKARQLGISWLVCAYALWLCIFQPRKLVLVFSQTEDDAFELVRRIVFMYERLPDWLRAQCPLAKEPAGGKVSWANGSRVRGRAATAGAGRGHAASLVIADEAAFMEYAEKVVTGTKPTIDAGGQLVLLSTANGLGNTFHRTWLRAIAGLNGFKAIFLPWWSRPGRDAAWYERIAREAIDPTKVKQEYPSTPSEAFVASQRVRFAPDWVAAQDRNTRPPLPASELPKELAELPGLKAWRLPWRIPESLDVKPKRLVCGADVAEGLATGDYSAGVLVDDNGEEWLSLNGHWEPGVYAGYLDTIGRAYEAEIAVERNNHGHAVLTKLKDLGTPRVVSGADGKRGWHTNTKTKPQMIDNLAAWLKDETITIRDVADVGEMTVYETLADGSTGAPSGYHDDRVMAWAIALGVHKLLGSRAWKFT